MFPERTSEYIFEGRIALSFFFPSLAVNLDYHIKYIQ